MITVRKKITVALQICPTSQKALNCSCNEKEYFVKDWIFLPSKRGTHKQQETINWSTLSLHFSTAPKNHMKFN